MAMGQTEASKKARKMDKREILSFHWAAKLGVLRRSRGTRRNHPKGSALLRPHSPDRAAHENQRRCNPYDPEWERYFEERLGVKMVHNLKGKRQLSSLWKEQHGLCPVCHQKITKLTGWNNHHIVRLVDGGADRRENRVLLHPNCHRQVHSQELSVVKPRSAKER